MAGPAARLLRAARALRRALRAQDLDGAAAAQRDVDGRLAELRDRGVSSDRERRWGRLAERALAGCEREVRAQQSRIRAELDRMTEGARVATRYQEHR